MVLRARSIFRYLLIFSRFLSAFLVWLFSHSSAPQILSNLLNCFCSAPGVFIAFLILRAVV